MANQESKQKEDRRGMIIGGIIVLGIGVLFLLGNLEIIPYIGETWPAILIIVGVALLIGSLIKEKPKKESQNSSPKP